MAALASRLVMFGSVWHTNSEQQSSDVSNPGLAPGFWFAQKYRRCRLHDHVEAAARNGLAQQIVGGGAALPMCVQYWQPWGRFPTDRL